ncbi:unnamed protein product [Rhizophagus irregularis]|nr:unnamed protein product [Rhizophagus irregularis]
MANSAHYKPWKKPWKRKQSSPDIYRPTLFYHPMLIYTVCGNPHARIIWGVAKTSMIGIESLLLDSREIKADNINHYLSSIIDELLRFWKEDSYLQTIYYTSHLDDKLPTRKKMPDSSKIVLYATTQPFGKGLRIKPYEAMNGQQCGIHSLNGDMKI